jgi:hypothetical protein
LCCLVRQRMMRFRRPSSRLMGECASNSARADSLLPCGFAARGSCRPTTKSGSRHAAHWRTTGERASPSERATVGHAQRRLRFAGSQ